MLRWKKPSTRFWICLKFWKGLREVFWFKFWNIFHLCFQNVSLGLICKNKSGKRSLPVMPSIPEWPCSSGSRILPTELKTVGEVMAVSVCGERRHLPLSQIFTKDFWFCFITLPFSAWKQKFGNFNRLLIGCVLSLIRNEAILSIAVKVTVKVLYVWCPWT